MPNGTLARIVRFLAQCGYGDDPRIHMGFSWLLSMRQDDGGWTIPMLTHKLDRSTWLRAVSGPWKTLEPDRSKPSSHNWTDMALRAFLDGLMHTIAPALPRDIDVSSTDMFEQLADLLEIREDNPFRIRAYRNAASPALISFTTSSRKLPSPGNGMIESSHALLPW